MSPRRTTCWQVWPLLGTLLLCAPHLPAQQPDPFARGLGIISREQLAVLTFASACDPTTRGYGVPTDLILGTSGDYGVWEIEPLALQPRFRQATGAATLFLAGAAGHGAEAIAPLNGLTYFQWGDREDIWTLYDTTKVERIPKIRLDMVIDGRGFPAMDSSDPEIESWCAFIIAAHRTPQSVFEAASDKEVSYGNLMESPKTFRGQVVRQVGQIKRIRKFAAPGMLKAHGITTLYEAWIFVRSNPFCVILTQLPKGMSVSESLEGTVQFDGYSYKKYRYTSQQQAFGKGNIERYAPLLIGKTLTSTTEVVIPQQADPGWWIREFLPYFVGGVVVMVFTGFCLLLWFRASDAAIKKRLRSLQAQEFVLPEPDQPPPQAVAIPQAYPVNATNVPGSEVGPVQQN